MHPKALEVVQKLGFPIAASIALGWFIVTTQEKHRAERKEWRAEHKEERGEWSEVVREEGRMNREINSKLTEAVHALEMTINRGN